MGLPLFHLPLVTANLPPVPGVVVGTVAALHYRVIACVVAASVVGDAAVAGASAVVADAGETDVVLHANFFLVDVVVVVVVVVVNVVLGGVHGHGGGDHAAGADHAVGHASAVHFLACDGDVAFGLTVDVPVDVLF